MQKDTLIIDISCDKHVGIETSTPTCIEKPTYTINGITHYVVDHKPTLFYKTISKTLSLIVSSYINYLIDDINNYVLNGVLIVEKVTIKDKRIIDFQHR